MIPEIGVFSLVLALLIAVVQGSLPLAGAQWGVAGWMRLARPAALGQFVFASIAFACLTWSFLDNDFSVLYVASNSHADLPAVYRFFNGMHQLLGWALALLVIGHVAAALRHRLRRDGVFQRMGP